eukprot:CAMPEP_0196660214 /NCGR_PEP_ID=MMETSP1086-20130531/38692_1 /TAXON_ID=77921 /ORGANISM="Cyanoptyche  gloeocystis , Strain SAG4.97" /LENGTH=300 /DNA_ID=CAMNT_0041994517 /DNA_START=258 /DNA_END=1161 /DNA_ORIENTATION=+
MSLLSGNGPNPEDDDLSKKLQQEDEQKLPLARNDLYDKIRAMGPDDVKGLVVHVSPEAVDAMKRTIMSMLGNLPPEYFQVTFATHRDNFKRLLFSAMMAGFSFRNVEYRLGLKRSLEAHISPSGESSVTDGGSLVPFESLEVGTEADGVVHSVKLDQVQGKVLVDSSSGQKEIDAAQYIASLQNQLEELRRQSKAVSKRSPGTNQLLEYLSQVEPDRLANLRTDASLEVLDAMEQSINNLLGNISSKFVDVRTTTTRDYMAHMLFWSMLTGYHLRTLETRKELDEMFLISPGLSDDASSD